MLTFLESETDCLGNSFNPGLRGASSFLPAPLCLSLAFPGSAFLEICDVCPESWDFNLAVSSAGLEGSEGVDLSGSASLKRFCLSAGAFLAGCVASCAEGLPACI